MFHVPEKYRVKTGRLGSSEAFGNNGLFMICARPGMQPMAVSAAVSELRANGRVIHCRREKDVWYYRRDLRAERKSA